MNTTIEHQKGKKKNATIAMFRGTNVKSMVPFKKYRLKGMMKVIVKDLVVVTVFKRLI